MKNPNRTFWIAAAFLLLGCAAPFAKAVPLPADLCSLLPTAVIDKTVGDTYSEPEKTVAPRPFPNTAQGTDCTYNSKRHTVVFRIYVDPSPEAATQLFAKLKMYFGSGSTAVEGLGDEAYRDANGALHVRKGKVRYFLAGGGTDQQRKDLATSIAKQL